MQLAASIFGYLGIASTLFILLQQKRGTLLFWKFICDLFWLLHYILINAPSAIAASIAALLRTWVFMNSKHSWAQGKRWLYIFLIICIIFAAIGWEGSISLFVLFGSMASVVAYW